ncbi:Regulatory protein RecX [Streptomyces ambofaciens ATCC 23877]|uniref:Regulatory protein RecX n=1 Tax=Streptomyces ambofaciens (strain ATCC 23877 / 3486 / DSM 40053 / JCM 4204 / NBRC 12836 / NRRL B-2516) TaxID=278992 RepID=A0A0K2AZU0_STRA7|nr:recombination regulator RecX [Streptomyces ambofaciens]AKZ58519.1 Regulatory protein RecX [Streptomyces ambofaciens ATCC 23877]
MTRRTDWAEYAYPDAAARERERRRPGGHGSAGTDDGAYGAAAAPYETDLSAAADVPAGVFAPNGAGDMDDTEGRYDTGETHDAGSPGGGARRGDGGAPGGGGRGRGTGGGRGRRRREPAEPFAEDGGDVSSSRAEQGEPPRDPVEQARAICLRLLTGTPRTRRQLADALRKREIPDEAAEEVLSRFEEVGLINDGAFADAWVESRHHGRGLARRALARELRTKGVEPTLIDAAVSRLDSEQEEETARELVDRKLRATRGLDRDKRLRRLAGMLARKGYPEGMALRVVRQALEEEGEDTEFLGDGEF